jgi:cytochrome c-type biogenesis protein CcmH/NrfG
MNNEKTRRLSPKIVVVAVFVGLGMIFLSTFLYRVENPSLTKQRRAAPPPSAETAEHGDDQSMDEIKNLMMRMRENPEDPEVLKSLGGRFMQMGSYQDAAGFLEKALMADPSDVETMMMIGVTQFNLENYPEAADHFELVLSQDPDNAMARYNLGVLYMHYLEKQEQAREHLRAVVESEAAAEDIKAEARRQLEAGHSE